MDGVLKNIYAVFRSYSPSRESCIITDNAQGELLYYQPIGRMLDSIYGIHLLHVAVHRVPLAARGVRCQALLWHLHLRVDAQCFNT